MSTQTESDDVEVLQNGTLFYQEIDEITGEFAHYHRTANSADVVDAFS